MTKLTCISPIDGAVFAERELDSRSNIDKTLALAKRKQIAWSQRPISERSDIVRKAVDALAQMNDDIVVELAHMMGRPVRYGGEIGGVKERAFHMCSIAQDALKPDVIEDSDQFLRYIAKEPVGIVFVVAPWNYPYLTAINSIAPALCAGNAVVLKHATQTLLAGERFEQAFKQAGLPQGLFTNLWLSHQLSAELIADKAFGFINFTGSVGGGKAIERAAAGTFCGVGLELGGKDPGYVRADADLDAAVDTLIEGAMFNCGQCCCGIERIYVHENLFDAFVEKAAAIVRGYKLGDPLETETTIGPMAQKRFADEVRGADC